MTTFGGGRVGFIIIFPLIQCIFFCSPCFSFSQGDYQNDWVYSLAFNTLRRGKLTYVVEMFVVVDHSIYQA